MAVALQKYEHRAPPDFATFNVYEVWLGADLMIEGLEMACKDQASAAHLTVRHARELTNGGRSAA